jgi:type I restriction enzyme M protein
MRKKSIRASKETKKQEKSLESWIWDAACSIRGAKDAPKYKDYILPLIFTKCLCDVFDDELNRIAKEVGSRKKAFQLVKADHKLVRFYLPLLPDDPEQPVWSVIRKLSDKIGEGVTSHMRAIARENPLLQGIIDRVDFNATTHGQRDLDDDRLSNLIEAISTKRLGLDDVEADIIGKSYEYLIRKFAEGSGQSAGEFYTPPEVGTIMSRVLAPEPGMMVSMIPPAVPAASSSNSRPRWRKGSGGFPTPELPEKGARMPPLRKSSSVRNTSPRPGPWPT